MGIIRAAFGESASVGDASSWLARSVAPRTNTGIYVSDESAMRFSAVFACVRVYSDTLGKLPFQVFKNEGDRKLRITDHPVARLLKNPNPDMTAITFKSVVTGHCVSRGNGYAEIQYDKGGRPIALWPLAPDRTEPKKDDNLKLWYQTNIKGKTHALDPSDVIHIPFFSFDGYQGYSPIALAREAVALGLAMEKLGSKFFSQGTLMGLTLEHPGKLSPDAVKNIKKAWAEQEAGIDNAFAPRILAEGMKLNPLTVPLEDLQFVEARKLQANDVARFWGMPLHKIQEMSDQKYANIEQEAINFATDTIQPVAVRWEEELTRKLFSEEEQAEGYYIKVNLNALMRGDSVSRANNYRSGILSGWLTRNEARLLEELDPIDGADELLTPLNMVAGADNMRDQTDERKTDSV